MSAVMPTASDLMNEIQQLRAQVSLLCRMQGKMLTRKQMLERYQIGYATLNKRVASGVVPTPGADGLWLVSEVFEYEARR